MFFAALPAVMTHRKTYRQTQHRRCDAAILFLRIFIGSVVLLHNLGKIQDYDELINTYPALLFNNAHATFAIFAILESVFAAMIIAGYKVRFAAFIMAMGMFLSIFVVLPTKGMTAGVLQFVYMGIYIFFVIAGGGRYAIDDCGCDGRKETRTQPYQIRGKI